MKYKLMSDGFWVTVAQASSAIGALLTVRILTELLTPDNFGLLALALGVTTLAQGLFCTPTLQALLRYYPDFQESGQAADLSQTTQRIILRRASYLTAAGLAAATAVHMFSTVPFWTVVLLSLLVFAEMWRSYEVTLFNPTRRQRPFAIIMILDATLRPTLAWCFARISGLEVDAVLAAFCTASVATATVSHFTFSQFLADGKARSESPTIAKVLYTFSLPIIPLAIIGWCNGTLDRYMIAGFLGSSQVGFYAAAYGLVSRPFLMIGQVLEQTIRPVYYEATSRNESEKGETYFRLWLGFAVGIAVFGFTFVYLSAEVLAKLFLSEAFRQSAYIMPWIALAYGLIGIVQALEIRLYASYQTRQALLIETTGIVAVIVSLPFLLRSVGVIGAAISLCVGAIAQLLVAISSVSRSRQSTIDVRTVSLQNAIDSVSHH